MKVVYLVHNVGDPAVRRRVEILLQGGASVTLMGFRRDDQAPLAIAGVNVVELGQSFDARMIQRAGLVLRSVALAGRFRSAFLAADVIIARNLEMLAIGVRARSQMATPAPLVYECLDIHRLLLAKGAAGAALRSLERWLMRRCSLLIVSSPAFIRSYFEGVQGVSLPSLLIENKLLRLDAADASTLPRPVVAPAAKPWRIGWFGMIRCQRSLDFLTDFVDRHPGLVEVVIRGRPSLTEFRDFEGQIAASPGVSFHGPYKPADLAAHYGETPFNWAIDYFEAGLNSDWLLPNRLYEGAAHGSVPIALAHVETGRWLAQRHAGILLHDLPEFAAVMSQMTADSLVTHRQAIDAISRRDLIATRADSGALTDRLASLLPDQAVAGARLK